MTEISEPLKETKAALGSGRGEKTGISITLGTECQNQLFSSHVPF